MRQMRRIFVATVALAFFASCSMRTLAVNKLGDAMAAGGTTFAADEDPELVGAALPFSLKLMESLLAESPRHTGLLIASARGFTQYTYGWVDSPDGDRARASRLYLRARDYGLRALATSIPDFERRWAADPRVAVASAKRSDVEAMYWTAASWALAISAAKDDVELLADLPAVEALLERAAQLDPDFDDGAIDTFLMSYDAAQSGVSRAAGERARRHFDHAVTKSRGLSAAPFVAAAEALAIPAQDKNEFEQLIARALDVNPDARPEWRLQNILAQRRARWLLAHADDFFLTSSDEKEP